MEIQKGYKQQLLPTPEQEATLNQWLHALRQVYNTSYRYWEAFKKVRSVIKKRLGENEKVIINPGYFGLKSKKVYKRWTKKFIPEWVFDCKVPGLSRQSAMEDLSKAYSNFYGALKRGDLPKKSKTGKTEFRKDGKIKGYPRKKKFKDVSSIRLILKDKDITRVNKKYGMVKITNMKLTGDKAAWNGWIKFKYERKINGITSARIYRDIKYWYITFTAKEEIDVPENREFNPIGVDLGIVNKVALSNGEFFNQPQDDLKNIENKIRKLNKKSARQWESAKKKVKEFKKFCKNNNADEIKKYLTKINKEHLFDGDTTKESIEKISNELKGSRRREIIKKRIAVLKRKQASIRNYHNNVASKNLAQNYYPIGFEDLDLRKMTKSSKGTKENPGKNIKQKSGLNREMLNQALGDFRRMTKYKAEWYGSTAPELPSAFTSQDCPKCEHRDSANRLSQSEFCCTQCGFKANADTVGATNVLHRLLKRMCPECNTINNKNIKNKDFECVECGHTDVVHNVFIYNMERAVKTERPSTVDMAMELSTRP